jgi:CubicO group peptidase (beta-lactamase class C family)
MKLTDSARSAPANTRLTLTLNMQQHRIQHTRMRCLAVIGLFITILAVGLPRTALAMSEQILQQEMHKILRQEQLTGVIWGTVSPAGDTFGAAGIANNDHPGILQPDHQFQVGSVTKTLLATGILRLVTQGTLTLDSPVSQLIPELKLNNPWADTHPLLLRHLLDHTSGLDDAKLSHIFSLQATADTPLSQAFSSAATRQLRSKPGSRLSYSNLGYTLLGMVIERVSGERYEAFLARELLAPLGMHHSSFAYVSQLDPVAGAKLAMGHFEQGETQPAIPMQLRPAGQFTTTAADLALFARFLLGDGDIRGSRFIHKNLLQMMGQPTTTEAVKAGLRAGYALGINSRDRHGVIARCHVGTTFGFRAQFCIFPEAKKAFFVAVNADVESARYDRFDQLLLQQLGFNPQIAQPEAAMPADIGQWLGLYQLAPVRMQSFAYLDALTNFASLQQHGKALLFTPFQGKPQLLTSLGKHLFRANDRVTASHVLYIADNTPVISDGFRNYQKASFWTLVPLWVSAIAGIAGLAYILITGLYHTVRRTWLRSHPLLPAFLACSALLLPVPFFAAQSFLQLGDLTLASASLSVVTGLLPVILAVSYSYCYRRTAARPGVDLAAMLAVLQWCLVLAYWGLLPLRLWA